MSEYIDRDAFLAHKRKLYCGDCDRRKGMKNGKMRILYDIGDVPCRACGIEDVLSDIEDFPEADVQPVVHGRWEEVHHWFEDVEYSCSVCGCYALYKGLTNDQICSEYCPNCGATMDGDNNG